MSLQTHSCYRRPNLQLPHATDDSSALQRPMTERTSQKVKTKHTLPQPFLNIDLFAGSLHHNALERGKAGGRT